MEEDCIKLVHRHQSSVVSCKASCLWTQIVVERLTSEPQIIFFAAICFVPEQNIFKLSVSCILLSLRIKMQVNIITIVINFTIFQISNI